MMEMKQIRDGVSVTNWNQAACLVVLMLNTLLSDFTTLVLGLAVLQK